MNIDFICPYPIRWNEIFNDLCAGYEKKIGRKLPSDAIGIREAGGPPTPLILNGWVFSTDADKRQRWIETIEWAENYELTDLLIIEEKDKCYKAG